MTQGPHAGTRLACECLGKMDRPRDCLAEKGMPEPEREKVWQGRGNMRCVSEEGNELNLIYGSHGKLRHIQRDKYRLLSLSL